MDNAIIFLGILVIPCIVFTVINIIYTRYKDVDSKKKISGFEVAREILDNNGLDRMYIVEVKGNLNDHYDSKQKVIRLSTDVFHGKSITAIVVAARMAAYAIQDKNNYKFMQYKFLINRFLTIAIYISYILFVLALCLSDSEMVNVSSAILIITLLFHLITLFVDFNANEKALKYITKYEYVDKKELKDVNKVLKVSPYTFIMTMITCISNLVNEIFYNISKRG